MPTGVEVGLAIAKAIKEAYSFHKFIMELTSPPDPATIVELYNRVVVLEQDVKELAQELANLQFEVRAAAVGNLTRDVAAQREQYATALRLYSVEPGWERHAHLAAMTLTGRGFWELPGRSPNAPTRFEPTFALPDFIGAVSTWILIRRDQGLGWPPEMRADLIRCADHLEWVLSTIEQHVEGRWSYTTLNPPKPNTGPKFGLGKLAGGGEGLGTIITIDEVYNQEPPPDPPARPEPSCLYVNSVSDRIREHVQLQSREETPGVCQNRGNGTYRPDGYLDALYSFSLLMQTAAEWRGIG